MIGFMSRRTTARAFATSLFSGFERALFPDRR
jgi:hypothetical protein